MSKKQVTIPIFVSHMGCPHQCVFCNQYEISNTHKAPDGNFVKNEVNSYLKTIPESVEQIEIAFFGGSFTGIEKSVQEELLAVAYQFKKEKKINAIRLSTRPDYISPEILNFLKEYSVDTIELGIQSLNDEVLKAAGRGHTSHDSYKACHLIKESNFNLIIQLMPGLPKANYERDLKTAIWASELIPAGIRLYPTVVLEKTPLAKIYKQKKYQPMSLEEAIIRVADITKIFNKKSIPVIKTGLHPFSNEEKINILAGPYHPAFGFLVKSRIWREKLEEIIKNFTKDELTIFIPDKYKEEIIGMKRDNILYIENKYKEKKITYQYSTQEKLFAK